MIISSAPSPALLKEVMAALLRVRSSIIYIFYCNYVTFYVGFFFGYCTFYTSNEGPPKFGINQTALHILCRIVFLINLSVDFMQRCKRRYGTSVVCVVESVVEREGWGEGKGEGKEVKSKRSKGKVEGECGSVGRETRREGEKGVVGR